MNIYLSPSLWYGSIFSNIRSFFDCLQHLFPLLSAFIPALSVCLQGPVLLWKSMGSMIIPVIPLFTLYSAPRDIGKVCLPKSIVQIGNTVRLLLRLWHWRDISCEFLMSGQTICEYLRLTRPWMKPCFFPPWLQKNSLCMHIAWGAVQCTFTSQFLSCYFQISFSLHSLRSNILIWWRDGSAQPFLYRSD